MFIEDEELRTLYRDASTEHLDKLEAGLLQLEKQPDDHSPFQEMLREAHSLKGDSRMLGVGDAETLTHQIEEILIGLEKGRPITSSLCDCLYQGLDAVRKIAHEAVTGEPSGVSVFHALAQLMGADESASQAPADAKEELEELEELEEVDLSTEFEIDPASIDLATLEARFAALENSGLLESNIAEAEEDLDIKVQNGNGNSNGNGPLAATLNLPKPEETQEVTTLSEVSTPSTPSDHPQSEKNSSHHIDTVRVEAAKLDALMTQAGELSVTKLRIARRMDDISKIATLWETWSRDILLQRQTLESLVAQLDSESVTSLQKLYQTNTGHLEQLGALMHQLRGAAYEDTARLESVSQKIESGILKLRMLPFSSLFSVFPRMVRDLARQQSKEINLIIEGGDTLADKRILEEMKDPLTHLIRNAIDHGIEMPEERLAAGKPSTATLRLQAYQIGNSIRIEVKDDGRGLDVEKIKSAALRRGIKSEAELAQMSSEQIQSLIFAPGFSTRTSVTELSGRGVGLDVVKANVERLKGTFQVNSEWGKGCNFRFSLKTNLATTFALIVGVNQGTYAIPVDTIDTMMRISREQIFAIEGNPTIRYQDQPLSVSWLSDLLDLPVPSPTSPQVLGTLSSDLNCVVINVGTERLGLLVDELLEQRDIVLKSHSKLLQRIRNITGATILDNGDVCMVLNPEDLILSARGESLPPLEQRMEASAEKPKVLLVEDSIPIRTQVKRILEGAGYDVTPAVDGLDGFNKLQEDAFAAVVSDVEMPNLTGLELTSRIREYDEYEELPIILVTTLAADEDKRRGADAGANAYITKGDFDQNKLLETLRRFI